MAQPYPPLACGGLGRPNGVNGINVDDLNCYSDVWDKIGNVGIPMILPEHGAFLLSKVQDTCLHPTDETMYSAFKPDDAADLGSDSASAASISRQQRAGMRSVQAKARRRRGKTSLIDMAEAPPWSAQFDDPEVALAHRMLMDYHSHKATFGQHDGGCLLNATIPSEQKMLQEALPRIECNLAETAVRCVEHVLDIRVTETKKDIQAPLKICMSCAHTIRSDWKFCQYCGMQL